MWNDFNSVAKTDCELCAGYGIYEASYELRVTEFRQIHKVLVAVRKYCDPVKKHYGSYRTICRCHLCNAPEIRKVPDIIGPWYDHQVSDLLRRTEENGEAKF